MWLKGAAITAFVDAPDPKVVAVLVYGPDAGLVRERSLALTTAVLGAADDPFRLVEVDAAALKDDPARLRDEAAAISLGGGRRVVRVRNAGDALAELVKGTIDHIGGETLVIVEAGNLGSRSALRRLFEGTRAAAALPCYLDEPETLDDLIGDALAAAGLTIEPAARAYLVDHLGSDRLISRGELEKLVLYMGPGGGVVGLDEAMACVGDSAELTLEDVAFATAAGDQARLGRALTRSFLEGKSPVQALRATAHHLQRLHLTSGRRDCGMALEQALRSLRPVVFYKREPDFRRQLGQWTTPRLASALDIVLEAEQACKATGAPQEALCSRALMRIAVAARSRASANR